MKALMNNWWKRLEFWAHWQDRKYDDGTYPPLISFSIEAYTTEHRPFAYYSSNDTNRWRLWHLNIKLSLYWIHLSLPFKKLPDYVPTGKAMLRTRRVQAEHEAKRGTTKV